MTKQNVTRIHMDLGKDGLTLAMAGAATSSKPGNDKLKAAKAKEGAGKAS
jgi:hypothetical protein